MRLILASKSAARASLLRAAGFRFEQADPGVAEPPAPPGVRLEDYVVELAVLKAQAVSAKAPDAWVIGCDTALILDGAMLGKAADEEAAVRMLASLCGRTHAIATGVAVSAPSGRAGTDRVWRGVDVAHVALRAWPAARLRAYVRTVQPFQCAGAYAVQADGAAIVERIDGDVSTVVGLPLGVLDRLLAAAGCVAD